MKLSVLNRSLKFEQDVKIKEKYVSSEVNIPTTPIPSVCVAN